MDVPDLLEVVELGLEALAVAEAEGRGGVVLDLRAGLDVVEGAEDAQAVALVLLEVADGALDLGAPLLHRVAQVLVAGAQLLQLRLQLRVQLHRRRGRDRLRVLLQVVDVRPLAAYFALDVLFTYGEHFLERTCRIIIGRIRH